MQKFRSSDHGLLYGDGIFEGIRFYNGRVFRLEEHLERLWDSARSICLEIPMDRGEMTEALLETIRQNGLKEGYIRLIVTRGVGNLGLNPAQCKRPKQNHYCDHRRALTQGILPKRPHGRDVRDSTLERGSAQSGGEVKLNNTLNNVMARIKANLAGADEALGC